MNDLHLSNTFKRVYFRINTPSYYKNKFGVGFETQEEGERFQITVTDLFLKDGWQIKEERYKDSGHCNKVTKDRQELYLHPQSVSGVVNVKNITRIEELLSNNTLFKFEKTDIYEDVFDVSDDEYIHNLRSKKSEIESDVLAAFKTKRRNLYITGTWDALQKVLKRYRFPRLSHYIGVYSSGDIDFQFISEVFENLVNANKIVTATTKNGVGYRSII